jgi:MinD-like ATPase involved in chromosome partitioning or flagellar assembly
MGLRVGALGHVLASAAPDRAAELVALDRAVRVPLPLSTRVGVVGVAGGSGCSVVAGLLAATLAARRPHRVLAVNASHGGRSLLWHAGTLEDARSSAAQDAARTSATSGTAATAGLVRTPGGLHCLDLAADGGPVAESRWWEALGPAGRFFDVVVTDWGARTAARSAPVAAASSVVCVVTPAERPAWQHAADLAGRFVAAGVPAVVAVDAVHGRAPAWCAEAVRLSPLPAVLLPHDRAHGSATPVAPARLRASTAVAVLRLAACLVAQATPDRRPDLAPASAGSAALGPRPRAAVPTGRRRAS